MLLRSAQFAFLLVVGEAAFASINNTDNTVKDVSNKLDVDAINKKLGVKVETRRRSKKKSRSTSSSSGEKRESSSKSDDKDSLEISSSSSSSSSDEKAKRYRPKSSSERHGWKKWHRKCTPCPEDMAMKWKDQRVEWICGAYQRARRSFKSLCMMHYRNCQDGTMFTKIHDHRCANSTKQNNHGDHFFYEYKVRLSEESSSSSDSSSDSMSVDETDSSDIYRDEFK